jgi:protein disulfide-isomerase
MRRVVMASVVALGCAVGTMAADLVWLTGFDQASKAAAERSVPIYAYFTGSDWCPWCKKMDGEILSQAAFADFAKTDLVLFLADFPMRKQLPGRLAEQNQRLARKYGVKAFPTVLLLAADGKELARTGYKPGGAAAYVEHLRGLLAAARRK